VKGTDASVTSQLRFLYVANNFCSAKVSNRIYLSTRCESMVSEEFVSSDSFVVDNERVLWRRSDCLLLCKGLS